MKSSEWLNIYEKHKNATFATQIQNHFSAKARLFLSLPKFFCPCCSYLSTLFRVCQEHRSNLLRDWILVQGSILQSLVNEYKTIFWGKKCKFWNFPKSFSYIAVSYKFGLKSAKSLNRIFWAIEYWFKTEDTKFGQRIQNHFSGKTRQSNSFFWKTKDDLETFQKCSSHIWVTDKPFLESGKSRRWLWLLLFRNFWILNIQLLNIQPEII